MGTLKEIEVGSSEAKEDSFKGNKELGCDLNEKKMKRKSRKYVPRFACFRTEREEEGNFDIEVAGKKQGHATHLIVMVNGLFGSAQDWRFAAKHFLKMYPEDVIVHCSERNFSTLTFDGVDVMGERLADEVNSVIKRHPSVKKISFIGHSLGGLIARYAIAILYDENTRGETSHGNCENDESKDQCFGERSKGKIAGLEPMNFITSATPHLGSRGHKQVPFFRGSYILEKAAARTSWWLGRTGKHLFLTDGGNGKPPLLLRMVSDGEDLKFMSALRSFRRHVVYSNIHFDSLVGWTTSSLRRRNELPKRHLLSRNDKYPHIVNIETATNTSPQEEVSSDTKVGQWNVDDMQEQMIRRLTSISWERIDVSFSGSRQRFIAHSTIQVNRYLLNSDGADVIQHMVDNFII